MHNDEVWEEYNEHHVCKSTKAKMNIGILNCRLRGVKCTFYIIRRYSLAFLFRRIVKLMKMNSVQLILSQKKTTLPCTAEINNKIEFSATRLSIPRHTSEIIQFFFQHFKFNFPQIKCFNINHNNKSGYGNLFVFALEKCNEYFS